MDREEFEKWWHGDDISRHPTNSYEGAMRWAYEGWVRGATAERRRVLKLLDARLTHKTRLEPQVDENLVQRPNSTKDLVERSNSTSEGR